MPEFTVKEVRVPELHLPEIKREDIVRTLSGARLPEIDMSKARRVSINVPNLTMSGADVGRLLAAGATIARLVRPTPRRRPWRMTPFAGRGPSPIERIVKPKRQRSRRPLAIAIIAIIAVGTWAILRRPDVRHRINLAVDDAKARMAARRADRDDGAVAVREPMAVMDPSLVATPEPLTPPTEDADSPSMSVAPDPATTEPHAVDAQPLEERTPAG